MNALIFLAFFYYLLILKYKFSKGLLTMVMFLPLLFLIGFRPFDWGADADTYIEIYNNIVNSRQVVNIEITFLLISKLVFHIGNCVKLLFLFYAMLSLSLKINSITQISYLPKISFLLYFSLWFVLHDIYQIRVGASLAVAYFSMPYLCNKKYFKFLLLAFCATLFHIQAALLFLLLFFSKKKISVYSVFGICLIIFASYVVYFLNIDVLSNTLLFLSKSKFPRAGQLKYYYEIAQSGIIDLGKINAFSPIVLIRMCLSLVLLFQYKRLNNFSYYPVLVRILTLSFAIRMFLYPIPVLGMRVYEFFTSIDIFVFPLLLKIFKEKRAVMTLLLFYCFFMLFIVLRGSF